MRSEETHYPAGIIQLSIIPTFAAETKPNA